MQIVGQTGLNDAILGIKNLIGEYEDASISNIKELNAKYSLQDLSRKIHESLLKRNS
jgi:hypothetical protein